MEKIEPASPATTWLHSLFGTKKNDEFLLIFTLPGETSNWFSSLDKAAAYAESAKDYNVYFGTALSPDPRELLKKYQAEEPDKYKNKSINGIRCKAEETLGIAGLWVDLDIKGPGHKKTNLPRTEEEALEIIAELHFEPSHLVFSGGGLQAWWTFPELWRFSGPEDRQRAALLVERWQTYVKKIAKEQGLKKIGQPFEVDSTHDLARVFWVPGTFNRKDPKNIKPVLLVQTDEAIQKYEPGKIEKFLDQEKIFLAPRPARTSEPDKAGKIKNFSGPLALHKDASPEFNAFQALLEDEDDKRFRQSWEHKRRDFTDQSTSGYDLSLATLAFGADWTPQEVTNLVIAHRRKWNEDLKLDRPDYYQRTITRAQEAFAAGNTTPEMLADQTRDARSGQKEPISAEKRKEILDDLSATFGVEVNGWYKLAGSPETYIIEIDRLRVVIGTADSVLNPKAFARAVYSAFDFALPTFKPKTWQGVVNKLGKIKTDLVPDETETEEGLLSYWLRKYLAEKPILENAVEGIGEGQPWYHKDGRVCFQIQEFRKYLQVYRVNEFKTFTKILNNIGAEYDSSKIAIGPDQYIGRAKWILPWAFSNKQPQAEQEQEDEQ